ncbi:MAG: hypothetical protein ACJ790_16105 [Myxococcaceae bacterium]
MTRVLLVVLVMGTGCGGPSAPSTGCEHPVTCVYSCQDPSHPKQLCGQCQSGMVELISCTADGGQP